MAPSSPTRRQFIASGLAVGMGLTAGCISITEDTRPFDELTTYHNEEYSYTVSYPASWTIETRDPTYVGFTTTPFDGWMYASAHDAVAGADSELTADIWNGFRSSQSTDYELRDKQFIKLPSGHTGVLLEALYYDGEHYMHDKTLWVVGQYTHSVSIEHITDAYSDKFETMATAIVGSLTIG